MNLGSAARRNGFWLLDRARDGRIRRHYEEVRASLQGGAARTGSARSEVLRGLLEHAAATTSFYAPYRGRELGGFPLIDKAAFKADEAAFRSSAFEGVRLLPRKSSGSTGEPVVIPQDRGKRERSIADTIAFNELAGQRLGDRLMWLFAARAFPMSWRKQRLQNIVPIDHVGLDEEGSERVVRILQGGRVNALLGINSTYQLLARHVGSRGVDPGGFGLAVVIATGENMVPVERERLAAAFGCPVVDRYSTEELGILASTTPGGDTWILNRVSYVFELLKLDADEPAVPGARARVVVTDLYNRATPLIRWDTGDLAVVGDVDAAGEPLTLAAIDGRRTDVVFDTSGGQVPSTSISAVLSASFPHLQRYQLVQTDQLDYRVAVVQGQARHDEAAIAAELRRWLGGDASIEVVSVADIPRLTSGKHRPVVRRWDPEPPT